MADMRDRLIELINSYPCMSTAEDCFLESISDDLADYLLANGVIVPPCKVGDTVYCIEFAENIGIDKGKVYAISCTDTEWFSVRYESGLRYDHPKKAINKTVFLSYKEAEKALKELENNG